MILNRLGNLFSTLAVKIFVGFWLITTVSIFSTRWISLQFKQDVIEFPAKKYDVKQLNRFANYLKNNAEQHPGLEPKRLLKRSSRGKKYSHIYLKDLATGDVTGSTESYHSKAVHRYLLKHEITDVVSLHTEDYYVTGPVLLNLSDEKYQLFLGRHGNSKNRPGFFTRLPPWARIAIPLTISLILCWLLAWSITKPIRRVEETTQKLGKGDLTARVNENNMGSSEIGHLAGSLNKMATQLQSSVGSQKRLLADISHELRSPLTRLQITLALANKVDNVPNEMHKYLERCELEIGRLDSMIGDVLQLSRLETSIQSVNVEHCNISQLLSTVINDVNVVAHESNVNIKTDVPPDVITHCDVQLISSAMENIINNAVKYSPQNADIDIRLTTDSNYLKVEVHDQGDGVPEESINDIFEPFYRVNDARDRKTGGTGLGLAIAKRAVIAHHGSIYAKNTAPGFIVVIELPIKTH